MADNDGRISEAALAREGIRHTMSVYNNAGDRGDFDEFVGAFTPDAVLEVFGERHRGHDGIRRFAEGAARDRQAPDARARRSYVRHHTTTSRIEVTGPDTAHGWTYFIIFADGAITNTGMYVDTFVKSGDHWRIASRRVKLDG